ncbi:MAG TPA: hypothetical protein VG621_01615 [Candidatus Paceibacterota bacterium]|nr:hypothetical protein [Candidatus Paceibacterota bacterium]
MTNQFAAKKLGEVLALCQVSTDTLAKGRAALTLALGEEKLTDINEHNHIHSEALMKVATDMGVIDTTLAKAEKTKEKIEKIRDMYVGEKWGNAVELLEWSGFFEGAAIVQWSTVKGIAEALNDEVLLTLCEEGVSWHYELLELAEGELEKEGADKTTG